MKTIILLIGLLLILIPQAAFAESNSHYFEGKYPSFADYEEQSLQSLKNYFYAFTTKSIIQDGGNHLYQLSFQNDVGEISATVMAKIERRIFGQGIQEKVIYLLPDGRSFIYSIHKHKKAEPTKDSDLLAFKFALEEAMLTLNNLDTWFDNSNEDLGLLSIGFMEISAKVETKAGTSSVKRSYSYFYKEMNPSPQADLNVEAFTGGNAVNYKHSSRGLEITPKTFFQGLNEGAGVFTEFSQISLQLLYGMGFPAIEDVN